MFLGAGCGPAGDEQPAARRQCAGAGTAIRMCGAAANGGGAKGDVIPLAPPATDSGQRAGRLAGCARAARLFVTKIFFLLEQINF